MADAASAAAEHDAEVDCIFCSAGKYADAVGTIECTVCSYGKYSSEPKSTSCNLCQVGKYIEDNGEDASKHNSNTDCLLCPAGTYSDSQGSSSCTICEGGSFSNAGSAICSTCPPGYECSIEGGRRACDSGKYSNGVDGCTDCLAGYKCPGGTNLVECSAGTYQNITGAHDCRSCEEGKYQPNLAQSSAKHAILDSFALLNLLTKFLVEAQHCSALQTLPLLLLQAQVIIPFLISKAKH